MTGLQLTELTNFEIAVLIGVGLAIAAALVLVARRFGPAPAQTPVVVAATAPPGEVAAVKADVLRLDGRLGEVEHHLAQVRTMMGALPSKDAVNKLEVKITEVAGRVDLTHEITVRNGRMLERIENRLINGAQI